MYHSKLHHVHLFILIIMICPKVLQKILFPLLGVAVYKKNTSHETLPSYGTQ